MDDVTMILSRNDVGQMLDGLEVLIEQWEATHAYHESGEIRPGTEIREANDAEEAANVVGGGIAILQVAFVARCRCINDAGGEGDYWHMAAAERGGFDGVEGLR